MMDNVINFTQQQQSPIEIALGIDEEGRTTAKKLYEFLELDKSHYSRWIKMNIEDNEFYQENIDWIGFATMANGNETKDYKLTTEFAKHLSMESKSAKGKEARQYFIIVEDKLKNVAKQSNINDLSPTLQMFQLMLAQSIDQERRIKAVEIESKKVAESVTNIKDAIVTSYDNWRDDIVSKVREISIRSEITYQDLFTQLYNLLEQRAKCNLSTRTRNKKARMKGEGANKSSIKSSCTKIAVIEEEQRLKEIFTSIVKEYAVKYAA